MILVNAMAKAHQAKSALFVLGHIDELRDITPIRDNLLQHVDAGFVGAAMQWPSQRAHSGG